MNETDPHADALARAKRAGDAKKPDVFKKPRYLSIASESGEDGGRPDESRDRDLSPKRNGHGSRQYRVPRPQDTPSHPGKCALLLCPCSREFMDCD